MHDPLQFRVIYKTLNLLSEPALLRKDLIIVVQAAY